MEDFTCQALERFANQVLRNWRRNEGTCKECPLRDPGLYYSPTAGRNNWDSKIAVVGLSPGEARPSLLGSNDQGMICPTEEVLKDWDWNPRWPATKALKAMVTGTGWQIADLYFTNLCKCPFIGGGMASDHRNQLGAQQCAGYLPSELRILAPRLVVTFGLDATRTLAQTGYHLPLDHGISRIHGLLTKHVEMESWLLPFRHWSKGHIDFRSATAEPREYPASVNFHFKRALRVSRMK